MPKKHLSPSPMTRLTDRIEKLLEPAARATRRGDAEQIKSVLTELRAIWTSKRKSSGRDSSDEQARGMTYAIEGILGFALASASSDSRRALVESRKHALPVLHALGKRAREAARGGQSNDIEANSIQMSELAEMVGVWAQNLSELIRQMSDCGLAAVTEYGQARRVNLTKVGAETLEAMKPGWQLMEVSHDDLSERLNEALREATNEFRAVRDSVWRLEADQMGVLAISIGSKTEPYENSPTSSADTHQTVGTLRHWGTRGGWVNQEVWAGPASLKDKSRPVSGSFVRDKPFHFKGRSQQ